MESDTSQIPGSSAFVSRIFTMVSYFLRWTLLKIFSSFSDNQSQQKVGQCRRITRAVINTQDGVKCLLLRKFWIHNFSWIILERILVGSIVNVKNECLRFFFWVHGGMNRSAEQTNCPRTASRFTRFFFVTRFDSFSMNPENKDTHSLIVPSSSPFLLHSCDFRHALVEHGRVSFKQESVTII